MIQEVTDRDLNRIREFLETHVETSLFLLCNLAELGHRLTDHLNSGNYRYIEENGEIQAVFCLTRRGNILAQSAGRTDCAAAILQSCEREPIQIQGVVAEWTIADAIWQRLCANFQFHPTFTSKETLFSLELSNASLNPLDAKTVRPLIPEDFTDWLKVNNGYLVEEGLPVQGTTAQREAQFVEQSTAGFWWGAVENGKLAATVALNAKHDGIGQIGGVYTLPEKRRKGLARRAMQLLINDSIDRHRLHKLILFTGEHNVAARELYKNLDFTTSGHFALLFGNWDKLA